MPIKSVSLKVFLILVGLAFLPVFKVCALETTAPVTSLTKNPASPNGKNSWYTVPVNITLKATDLESGVKEINYKIDSGAWQKKSFANTLNLAPNPSFEKTDVNETGLLYWDPSFKDQYSTFSQDTNDYASGFESSSAKVTVVTGGTGWHGINHLENFAVADAHSNMIFSAYLKTDSVTTQAYVKIYAVTTDDDDNKISTLIYQGGYLTGTNNWTQVSDNFTVDVDNAKGVYMDIGLEGTGTVWVDAVSLNSSITNAEVTVPVGTDGSHTFYYYSVDQAGNIESTKSTTFKIDQTPPGNWHDSGAIRGLFGTSYQLWVYATVEDATSGISTFTDKYQYKTDNHDDFGRYSDILNCSSTWNSGSWLLLISPPFLPGAKSAYILTPKTSFCNNNWSRCKYVRFYSEDMAGNTSSKDYCINGPWIKVRGGGIVRGDGGINMLAEASGDNTDSLIESGTNTVDFFTSTKNWVTKNSETNNSMYTYDKLSEQISNKTTLPSTLPTSSGSYIHNGNLDITSSKIPSGYNSATFNQVVFVNGDLTISTNVDINAGSSLLFVVNGDTKILKAVTLVDCAIVSNDNIYTASDIVDGDSTETLVLQGFYAANKFIFQRTLQGTDNTDTPSENFIYEPKYLVKMIDFLGENNVEWRTTD